MRTYYGGIALALLILASLGSVSGATYDLYIQWDEQPVEVYAGQNAEFYLTLTLSSTGPPETSDPGPGSPSTSTPTPPVPSPPPTPPTGNNSVCVLGAAASSGMMMSYAGTVVVDSTVDISYVGWSAKIYDEQIYLADGESKEVRVKVAAPDDAAPGEYTLVYTAKASNTNEVTAELVVIVKEPYDLQLSNMTLSPANPTIGDTVTFSADATLVGDAVLTNKIVALYINEISPSKLADTTLSISSGETKKVSVAWIASATGNYTARLYANPSAGDVPVENNEIMRVFSVSEASDPCATAIAVYNEALALYDDDCQSAISKLTVAQTLFNQCGDGAGADECQMLIDKCNQLALAEDLGIQGDSYEEVGDCENAIAKWTSARDIYLAYGEQEKADALQEKIDNCSVEEDKSFIAKNWWWIILLLLLIAALLIYLAAKRKDEEEQEPLPPAAAPPFSGAEGAVEQGPAVGVIPPIIAKGEEKEIPAEVAELIGAIDRALAYYTKDVITHDMKKAVDAYAKMVDTRNEMSPNMDDETRTRVDQMIKVLEDRIFDTL